MIAAVHDRASVNTVALRTIKVLYNQVFDIGSFSPTLDRVGENMETPVLEEFIRHIGYLFFHTAQKPGWCLKLAYIFPIIFQYEMVEEIKKVHDSC